MFSTTTEHALRALVALSDRQDDDPVLARDLAEDAEVPLHYLSKVLATLTRAGILQAARGLRGGYRLARPAEQISLVEIVDHFEGTRAQTDCLLWRGRTCDDLDPCTAHASWKEVRAGFVAFLENTTLADLTGGRSTGRKRKKKRSRVGR